MVSFTTLLMAAAAALNTDALNIPRQAKTPVWLTLPATPALPTPISATIQTANGVKLWMQTYNAAAGGTPIVMSHGGLGHSAYFGSVIQALIKNGHQVIALDRRGHGRSPFNNADTYTYDIFAKDTDAQLKAAGVKNYIYVGWSDGAIVGLSALMDPTLSKSITKAFLFGTSAVPADTNATFSNTAIFNDFVTRVQGEYKVLQPSANFTQFGTKVATLEATLPQFKDADLAKIDGSKVTMVQAEHEEAVNNGVGQRISKAIPGSKFVMLNGVSHFAPLQDPAGFTSAIEAAIKA